MFPLLDQVHPSKLRTQWSVPEPMSCLQIQGKIYEYFLAFWPCAHRTRSTTTTSTSGGYLERPPVSTGWHGVERVQVRGQGVRLHHLVDEDERRAGGHGGRGWQGPHQQLQHYIKADFFDGSLLWRKRPVVTQSGYLIFST